MTPKSFAPNIKSRDEAINDAYVAYDKYKDHVKLHDRMIVVNMREPSYHKRMYIVKFIDDPSKEEHCISEIERCHHVAHGEGSSDPLDAAYATSFSNINDSHKSSLGAMVTDDTYHGKHGLSCRLNGLEKGKNDQVRRRSIVVHGAHYVTDKYILRNGRAGQSWGCPAVDINISNEIIALIKGGRFFYVHY